MLEELFPPKTPDALGDNRSEMFSFENQRLQPGQLGFNVEPFIE